MCLLYKWLQKIFQEFSKSVVPSTLKNRNVIEPGTNIATTSNLMIEYRLPEVTDKIESGRPRLSNHSGNCNYQQKARGIGIPCSDSQ